MCRARARHRKKALFLPRPAPCGCIQSRRTRVIGEGRTRVIGEGVSAHVNVMDSWPLVLHSVPVDGHLPTIVGKGKRFVSS